MDFDGVKVVKSGMLKINGEVMEVHGSRRVKCNGDFAQEIEVHSTKTDDDFVLRLTFKDQKMQLFPHHPHEDSGMLHVHTEFPQDVRTVEKV